MINKKNDELEKKMSNFVTLLDFFTYNGKILTMSHKNKKIFFV